MKTIIDKQSGKLLYATDDDNVKVSKNEIAIDIHLNTPMAKPFFNFETKEYYETATEQEVEAFKIENLIE